MTSEWIKEDYERRRRAELFVFFVRLMTNAVILGIAVIAIYLLTIMLFCG